MELGLSNNSKIWEVIFELKSKKETWSNVKAKLTDEEYQKVQKSFEGNDIPMAWVKD
ncbi:hypothetical protein [Tetragenococcus halophilus]|uniref:hypothetical protein n=1 Tax=Tetragenococcus halophilus TaxID=51669 RepID=UPI00130059B9|nr:hypothetical protein [Tetragenococcus halophilus]